MTLVRYQPFANSLCGMPGMQQMMNSFFRDLTDPDSDKPTQWSPRIEVTEDDNRLLVTAELPGLGREDVQVDIQNNVLTISGEKKSSTESNEGNVYIRERGYGRFSRSFELPTLVEIDKINATFKNGVLTLDLPKIEAVKPKHIEVKID